MLANNHPLWQEIWTAPAKINEFLHVVGQRKDGYHLLQTVFRLLKFADFLKFAPAKNITLKKSLVGVPAEKDLCYRAAKLLQEYSQTNYGVEIELIKNIPMGAGLGGGSSDAATVLLALNQLWQLNYSAEILAKLALSLGADVPVFIDKRHAFAEGIGEILTPIDLLPCHVLIIKPQVAVASATIFKHPDLPRNIAKITLAEWKNSIFAVEENIPKLKTENSLQAITTLLYPEVGEAINLLNQFAEARMSGSGSAVFAKFAKQKSAEQAYIELKQIIETSKLKFDLWITESL